MAYPVSFSRPNERKIAEDVVKRVRSGIVLDIGSGTGFLAIEIAKRAPDLQVYGVDLSKKMVDIATGYAKGLKNAKFVLANAAELPYESGSIDFIVSTGSLHHWKEPVRVFDELYRVLKEGNEAWIYDGCADALRLNKSEVIEKYGHLMYQILIKLTEMHGFELEEYEHKIKSILERTKFKDSYTMQMRDMWMKITLRKM